MVFKVASFRLFAFNDRGLLENGATRKLSGDCDDHKGNWTREGIAYRTHHFACINLFYFRINALGIGQNRVQPKITGKSKWNIWWSQLTRITHSVSLKFSPMGRPLITKSTSITFRYKQATCVVSILQNCLWLGLARSWCSVRSGLCLELFAWSEQAARAARDRTAYKWTSRSDFGALLGWNWTNRNVHRYRHDFRPNKEKW